MIKRDSKLIYLILIGVLIFNPVGTIFAGPISQTLSSNQSTHCKMKKSGHSHSADMKQKMDHSSMTMPQKTGCKCLNSCNKNYRCNNNCNHFSHAFVVVSSFENSHILIYSPLNDFTSNIHHQLLSIQHFRPPRPFRI